MDKSDHLLSQAFQAFTHPIAIMDSQFTIVYVNQAWSAFSNQYSPPSNVEWIGYNYYQPESSLDYDSGEFKTLVIQGLTKLRNGTLSNFTMEYPSHSDGNAWYEMKIDRFQYNDSTYFIISHQDISQRKNLERENQRLTRTDPLTKIANRRRFDEFLDYEWHHCRRNQHPISLAIVDIDGLKAINDSFGHEIGDNCLREVAQKMKQYTGRASDMCARLGSDEFVALWGNTSRGQSLKLAHNLLNEINTVPISALDGQDAGHLGVSIGLCSIVPTDNDFKAFVTMSDSLMYEAKQSGKNRINVRSR